MHFTNPTKQYVSSKATVKEVEKYIPQYEKNRDVSMILKDKMEAALNNSMKLIEKYDDEGREWPSTECNPRTDVGNVVELVRKK